MNGRTGEPEGCEVLATVRASPFRRGAGLAVMWLLGGLLLWVAFLNPAAGPGLRAGLAVLGLGAFWAGERMRRATVLAVELTEAGLRGSDGESIARWETIAGVGGGAFAFKPSHGFVVRLTAPAPARWQPGLWWRWGRWIGVGGLTPGPQSRLMAEIIAARLRERDAG